MPSSTGTFTEIFVLNTCQSVSNGYNVAMASIADQLRRAIERSGKSRYRIAQESGVAEAVLSRFVNGERDLKLETANKLCVALGLRVVLEAKGKQGAKKPKG